MKIDFTELKLVDMDGNSVPFTEGDAFHKNIANILYQNVTNLDLVEVAKTINSGSPVELRDSEFAEIEQLLLNPAMGLASFARKAVADFMRAAKENVDE